MYVVPGWYMAINPPVLNSPHAPQVPVERVESPSRVWELCHRDVSTNWRTDVFLLSKLGMASMYLYFYLYLKNNLYLYF